MDDWINLLLVIIIGLLIITLTAVAHDNEKREIHITNIGDPTCMDKLNQCWNQCEGDVIKNQPPVFVYISGQVN